MPEQNYAEITGLTQDPNYRGGDDAGEGIDEAKYSSAEKAAEIIGQYWANKSGKELWDVLVDKQQEYFESLSRRGFIKMYSLVFGTYFGLDTSVSGGVSGTWSTQSMKFSGEDGELLELNINEIRSFYDQICNMQTKNRPSFEAQALNTDFDSMAQVEASDTLVKYYFEQIYGERKEKEAVKREIMYGKSFTHLEWDPDGGPFVEVADTVETPHGPVESPSKRQVRAGEFVISVLYPWLCVSESARSEYDGHNWRLVICPPVDKHEAIARWPLFAEQIESSNPADDVYACQFPGTDPAASMPEDMCSKHIFYHCKTAACPGGRKVVFINGIQVSGEDEDDSLPIDVIPVVPLMSCELHGTSHGSSDLWNLIPAEQLQNQILSDIATNVEAFGRPPMAMYEGTDVDLDALASGQKMLFLPPGTEMPQAIKFPQVPDVSFKVVEMMRQFKQSLSGLNAVARGDTSSNITSGAHAALYSQTAIEAQSPRALELDLAREAIANVMLQFLKKYAKHPQMVAIAGKDERAYLETFTSDDLAGVHKVVIKTANPALKTSAGRLQIAQLLSDWPGMPLTDPAAIIELITTGQWKPAYNLTRVSELHIRWENEQLLEGPEVTEVPGDVDPATGQPAMNKTVPTVPVLSTEDAKAHLVGHLEVVYSPAAQKNPKVKEAALAHILEHVRIARTGDPYLAQILGITPPQQMDAPPDPNAKPGKGPTAAQSSSAEQAMTKPDDKNDKLGAGLPTPATPSQAPPGAGM